MIRDYGIRVSCAVCGEGLGLTVCGSGEGLRVSRAVCVEVWGYSCVVRVLELAMCGEGLGLAVCGEGLWLTVCSEGLG